MMLYDMSPVDAVLTYTTDGGNKQRKEVILALYPVANVLWGRLPGTPIGTPNNLGQLAWEGQAGMARIRGRMMEVITSTFTIHEGHIIDFVRA